MNPSTEPRNSEDIPAHRAPKLMDHGFVRTDSNCALSIEVRRGMTIRSTEGLEVGKVAAVLLNDGDRTASHILLGRLPEISGYWMVPVGCITQVGEEDVQLSLPGMAVEALPRWRSG